VYQYSWRRQRQALAELSGVLREAAAACTAYAEAAELTAGAAHAGGGQDGDDVYQMLGAAVVSQNG
jgi:hypothetical protein